MGYAPIECPNCGKLVTFGVYAGVRAVPFCSSACCNRYRAKMDNGMLAKPADESKLALRARTRFLERCLKTKENR